MKLVDNFLNYMRGRNLSDVTIFNYGNAIKLCFDYLNVNNDEQLLRVSQLNVISYLNYLVNDKGLAASTRNEYYKPVRQLYEYLINVEKINNIDTGILEIPLAKTEKKKAVWLKPYDAQELLDCINEKRAKAIVSLFLTTGIRISELINIKLSDMSERTHELGYNYYTILINGKGNKQRIVTTTFECYKYIKKYIIHKRQYIVDKTNSELDYLFLSNNGIQMDTGNIRKMIKTYGKKSGFKDWEKLSPHKLRHTYATNMIHARNPDGGVKFDIETISRSMGHESLATTSVYSHTDDDLVSEMQIEGWQ